MSVSDETLDKIARWLFDFDTSVEDPETGYAFELDDYMADAKDLVEKCGLTDV